MARLSARKAVEEIGASPAEKDILDKAYALAAKILKEEAIDHARELRRIEMKGEIDKISGLLRIGAFEEMYVLSTSGLEDGKKSILFYFDFDRFKMINDEYGHDKGDEVLRRCGAAIRKITRTTDYGCRPGGDEFMVLVNEIDDTQSPVDLAAKIAAAIGDINITDDSAPMAISIGCIEITNANRPFFSVAREEADSVSNTSKKSGGNRLTVLKDGKTNIYAFDHTTGSYVHEKEDLEPELVAGRRVDAANQRFLEEIERHHGSNMSEFLKSDGAQSLEDLSLRQLKAALAEIQKINS